MGHQGMELRQIRYFVRVVELGSITRAALDLGIAQSAVSLQISQLESELSVRLLHRNSRGVTPTEAGNAFLREAYVILRHAQRAICNSQQSRLMGTVTIGFAPASTPVLSLPFLRTMRARYPDIKLHMVESLSGHLTNMLDNRQLDIAILFNPKNSLHWSATPLLEQKLYLISPVDSVHPHARQGHLSVRHLKDIPLLLPTASHGLRSMIDAACIRSGFQPQLIAEIDSLSMLMDAVYNGLGATVQPWAAMARYADTSQNLHLAEIIDPKLRHTNSLCSLYDEELSGAALRARSTLKECVISLVRQGEWIGATLVDA